MYSTDGPCGPSADPSSFLHDLDPPFLFVSFHLVCFGLPRGSPLEPRETLHCVGGCCLLVSDIFALSLSMLSLLMRCLPVAAGLCYRQRCVGIDKSWWAKRERKVDTIAPYFLIYLMPNIDWYTFNYQKCFHLKPRALLARCSIIDFVVSCSL